MEFFKVSICGEVYGRGNTEVETAASQRRKDSELSVSDVSSLITGWNKARSVISHNFGESPRITVAFITCCALCVYNTLRIVSLLFSLPYFTD